MTKTRSALARDWRRCKTVFHAKRETINMYVRDRSKWKAGCLAACKGTFASGRELRTASGLLEDIFGKDMVSRASRLTHRPISKSPLGYLLNAQRLSIPDAFVGGLPFDGRTPSPGRSIIRPRLGSEWRKIECKRPQSQ